MISILKAHCHPPINDRSIANASCTAIGSPPLKPQDSIDVLAPPTPTRFGLNSASIIDYALIKNLNWPCNISSIPELSSDHNPIKLHFPRTSKFELPPPQLNTTWSKFTLNLANTENLYLHNASSTSEIENEVRELTREILTAHGNASKPVTHSEVPFVQDNKYGRNTLPLWILRTDPFGEPPKRSEGRPPRSQPLMALPILPECLEDCSGGPDSQTWERSHVSGIHRHISVYSLS
ncbi:RNA-directed DNA polymerase from mobile element jockey [Trichonephila clavipes]|nr:RNA-directed DNA polymerase from mobile element jockey [Trichonephila clavipes]